MRGHIIIGTATNYNFEPYSLWLHGHTSPQVKHDKRERKENLFLLPEKAKKK